jgi:tryptophan-rich sensory protein
MTKEVDIERLAICVILTELIGGGLGSTLTLSSLGTWYAALNKPPFTPSGSVIGFVWIVLYFLMGIALYLVWRRTPKSSGAYMIYSIQLALNLLWSFLFFYLRSPMYGMIGIVLLWISIAATMMCFYRISKTSAALLVPYILWVSFAAYLNYLVLLLNH